MILLKLGVTIEPLKRAMRRKLSVIDKIFADYGEDGIISSTVHDAHGASSLHYTGLACDLLLPKDKTKTALIYDELKRQLTDCDVILEHSRNHYHIEYEGERKVYN